MKQWQRLVIYTALLLSWAVFAAWQYYGYRHERGLINETLHQQSHSVMNALVGGIRSHRRLGCFFADQLQGILDDLVLSQAVLAVAVTSEDGRPILAAGKAELIDTSGPIVSGDYWDASGFRLVEQFELLPGECPLLGRGGGGPGGGWGGGWGGDLRPARGEQPLPNSPENQGPFAGGGRFIAALLLDRARCDALCRSAAWSHILVAAAGALVLMCMALAWRASVRMVEARGRAAVLETEARHLRDLSQAAAGLAHETRNPLGLVRGWTQRLAESDLDAPESQRHAQVVIEECDRVTARINQFLAFARPCRPSPEPVDPEQVIAELAAILQPDLEAKNLELECAAGRPARTIQADRELLRQALFNLVQNAIQFSPEGDTVRIAVVSGSNGACRIEVADRGPGVAEDAVDSLFTPYFTTRSDGTGLGLAIVRRIATAHGWDVKYCPRGGGGSVFSLDGLNG